MAEQNESPLVANLADVKECIAAHAQPNIPVRLVAVSKTKPMEDIATLYQAGQRHFGENYVQELVEKSAQLPADIHWHFIGAMQGNKSKTLAGIANLWALETLASESHAMQLNKHCMSMERTEPLRVFVQVNTSDEDNKSGVQPSEALALCRFVHEYCPGLQLAGLMTIGAQHDNLAEGEVNPDFVCLKQCRDTVAEQLKLPQLELSMGMSHDYAAAITAGATNVRVGSSIFGARQYPKPQ